VNHCGTTGHAAFTPPFGPPLPPYHHAHTPGSRFSSPSYFGSCTFHQFLCVYFWFAIRAPWVPGQFFRTRFHSFSLPSGRGRGCRHFAFSLNTTAALVHRRLLLPNTQDTVRHAPWTSPARAMRSLPALWIPVTATFLRAAYPCATGLCVPLRCWLPFGAAPLVLPRWFDAHARLRMDVNATGLLPRRRTPSFRARLPIFTLPFRTGTFAYVLLPLRVPCVFAHHCAFSSPFLLDTTTTTGFFTFVLHRFFPPRTHRCRYTAVSHFGRFACSAHSPHRSFIFLPHCMRLPFTQFFHFTPRRTRFFTFAVTYATVLFPTYAVVLPARARISHSPVGLLVLLHVSLHRFPFHPLVAVARAT